jgi:hypothetical protein
LAKILHFFENNFTEARKEGSPLAENAVVLYSIPMLKLPTPEQTLAGGIIAVIAGVILLVTFHSGSRYGLSMQGPQGILVVGGAVLYRALTKNHRNRYVFLGLFLFLTGATFLISGARLIPWGVSKTWPALVLFSGLSLLASGCYRRKRLGMTYLIPGAALIVLSALFFLFSLDIIEEPFSVIAARWWPLGLIALGFVLVVLFFLRSKTPRSLLP